MNPVSAFLAIDWYTKDPKAAYATLAMPLKDQDKKVADISDKDIPKLLKQLSAEEQEEPENENDISET